MSKSYQVTVCFLSLLAFGCAPPAPTLAPAPLIPFNVEEVRWSLETGTAIIEGQAFLKTRGGDVKYGAGNPVYLMPHSPHSFAWYASLTAGRAKNSPSMDPGLAAVTRKTVAGGDGRFRFEGLPAGPYLILTGVTWQTATGYGGSLQTQGGFVGAPVTAESGKTVSVIVTR